MNYIFRCARGVYLRIAKFALAVALFSMTLVMFSTLVSFVKADPGISVTIEDVDPYAPSATYIVRAESITTESENVKLAVSGDPSLTFSWTIQEFPLDPGEIKEFPLEVNVAAGTLPGNYEFTAYGEAWPTWMTYDEALMIGMIQTSSYTTYTYVAAVPEFSTSFSAIASLALCMYLIVRKTSNPTRASNQ